MNAEEHRMPDASAPMGDVPVRHSLCRAVVESFWTIGARLVRPEALVTHADPAQAFRLRAEENWVRSSPILARSRAPLISPRPGSW
jgi:hypothetical protein